MTTATIAQQNPPASAELMDAAWGHMLEHGLSPHEISPATVALAIHKPKEVRDAESLTILGEHETIVDRVTNGPSDTLSDRESQVDWNKDRMYKLSQRTWELSRGQRRRRMIGGLIAGATLAVVLVRGVSDVDAAFYEDRTGEATTGADTLYADDSILPGDLGANTPFLSRIRTLIPGVPDRNPIESTTVVRQERTVSQRQVRLEGSYNTANTINPASPDLSLTGVEYQQARAEAERMVQDLADPSQLTITRFGSIGKVSDEFGGETGEVNPEQHPLAIARAEVAARALKDVLLEHGYEVRGEPVIRGREIVLTPEQQANLRGQALEDKLARDRGAELWIRGQEEIVEFVPRTVVEETESTNFLSQFPNEGIAALPLVVGGMYGGIAAAASGRRGAHRVAKRQLRRATRRANKQQKAA